MASDENNFLAKRAVQELVKAREWCGFAQQQHGAPNAIHVIGSIDVTIRAIEAMAGIPAHELIDYTLDLLPDDCPF